jgi:hypothetical protein
MRDWLLGFAGFMLLALLLLPAIYLTALLITSLVFMPMLVGVVAQRITRRLQASARRQFRRQSGQWPVCVGVYLLLWLITLPFWLLGPFGVVISVLLNAWLNQRMFLYDALSEHASADELQQLRRDGGWPLYLLAALLGLLHYVPLLNFFAPVYMGWPSPTMAWTNWRGRAQAGRHDLWHRHRYRRGETHERSACRYGGKLAERILAAENGAITRRRITRNAFSPNASPPKRRFQKPSAPACAHRYRLPRSAWCMTRRAGPALVYSPELSCLA